MVRWLPATPSTSDRANASMASLRVATTCSAGRRDSGKRGEQQVIDRSLVDGDPHAPEIVEAVGIARQARTHHHHLRERPRLIEQLILGGAVLGVREEHHVGLAGVEVLHALVALAQADLDRHARFARQRANQDGC